MTLARGCTDLKPGTTASTGASSTSIRQAAEGAGCSAGAASPAVQDLVAPPVGWRIRGGRRGAGAS